jgi:RNA polymerase sigma-70 factor (family 1)
MLKKYLKPYQECDASFDQLFKKYHRSLILYATQIVRDRIVAEDLVSEAFFKFLLNVNDEKSESSKLGFLYACTRNVCIDFIRRQKLKERLLKNIFRHSQEYEDITLNLIIRKELVAKVRNAIETLPPVCKRVITLSYMHGLNRVEIAQELKISPNTVRNHISVGLKLLKARLIDCVELYTPWEPIIESIISQKIAV